MEDDVGGRVVEVDWVGWGLNGVWECVEVVVVVVDDDEWDWFPSDPVPNLDGFRMDWGNSLERFWVLVELNEVEGCWFDC